MVKVLVTGGGTGGHVLPIQAVASELKAIDPKTEIAFVQQRGDRFADLFKEKGLVDTKYSIFAGKFRRYHGVPLWKQLLDIPTVALNVRDGLYNLIGLFQSLYYIFSFKPDVVFLKGGFVGVPVGFAAHILRKPIVTHDSDTVPGLANRIASRWAVAHAVGAPVKYYDYPKEDTYYVGVPIADEFEDVSTEQQQKFKRDIHFDGKQPLVMATGGSLGAANINQAMLEIAPELAKFTNVIHITGDDNIKEATEVIQQKLDGSEEYEYKLLPFIEKDFYKYTGASDVIVTRSGSAVLEFAAQGRALILIANPKLTGGHQTKNAAMYEEAEAAMSLNEEATLDDPALLLGAIKELVGSDKKRAQLQKAIKEFAKPNAAKDLAEIIIKSQKEG